MRKVTVSCNGRFAKDYIVYIYPLKENYIKVTKKPVLVRDEDAYTIRGGEVGVYLSDGALSKTVSIDDCEKEYGDGYVGITYNDMNTSLRVLKLETYAAKDEDNAAVEKTATWHYLSEDTTITSDMCVLSLYKQCDGMTDEEIEAYSRLQSMIVTAGSIIQEDYSEPSYRALRDAIAEAAALTTISTVDEFNAAYDAIEAAQNALKTATTRVIVSSNPSNSGILTGGGRYYYNKPGGYRKRH